MPGNDFREGERKAALANRLDNAHRNVVKDLEKMLRVLIENGDEANAVKIKQAIIAVRVTYNRARHKLR